MLGPLLSLALSALSAHKLRSLLTTSSIVLGAGAIVLMTSLAQSGLESLLRGVEELGGARILLVEPKQPERGRDKAWMIPRGFGLDDRDAALEGVPHVEVASLYAVLSRRDALADTGKTAQTALVASDERFFDAFRMRVATGRAFGEQEVRSGAAPCLVGPDLAKKLWPGSPVGRLLSLGSLRCRVIGVLADNRRFGNNFGFEWNDLVVAPLAAVAEAEPELRAESGIIVRTDLPAANEAVKRIVNARLLRQRSGVDDFTFFDLSSAVARFRSAFVVMEALVALIAGIALLVGGAGVMNMMLVGVSERVREIGIRKALGATPGAIGAQFLAESALLAGFGGAVGTGAGVALAALAGALATLALPAWTAVISLPAVVAAFGASLVVGLLSGWLPARRAAGLDPVEAMRR